MWLDGVYLNNLRQSLHLKTLNFNHTCKVPCALYHNILQVLKVRNLILKSGPGFVGPSFCLPHSSFWLCFFGSYLLNPWQLLSIYKAWSKPVSSPDATSFRKLSLLSPKGSMISSELLLVPFCSNPLAITILSYPFNSTFLDSPICHWEPSHPTKERRTYIWMNIFRPKTALYNF